MSLLLSNRKRDYKVKGNSLNAGLIRAIQEGSVTAARYFIEKGADVNFLNKDGFTPLMFAAINGKPQLVAYLVECGAGLDAENFKGSTALMLAKFNGNVKAFDVLLKAGADLKKVERAKTLNLKIEEGMKYSNSEIIKSASYCENPEIGNKRILAMVSHLGQYGSERGHLVITAASLSVLGKDKDTGKTLEFFAADGKNLYSFSGDPMDEYLLGGYTPEKNMIQMCNSGTYFDSALTFMHELTHKVHLAIPDDKVEELAKATIEFREHVKKLISSNANPEFKKGIELVNEEMIKRVYVGGGYPYPYLQVLEHVADLTKMELWANKIKIDNPEMARGILYSIEPIRKFFDKELKPQICEYIINHEKRKQVDIPQMVRKELQKYRGISYNLKKGEKITIDINKAALKKASFCEKVL